MPTLWFNLLKKVFNENIFFYDSSDSILLILIFILELPLNTQRGSVMWQFPMFFLLTSVTINYIRVTSMGELNPKLYYRKHCNNRVPYVATCSYQRFYCWSRSANVFEFLIIRCKMMTEEINYVMSVSDLKNQKRTSLNAEYWTGFLILVLKLYVSFSCVFSSPFSLKN